jgi:hypothetical protein
VLDVVFTVVLVAVFLLVSGVAAVMVHRLYKSQG